ncbi:c-type cytochrome biogenesis protein CcmI [Colwellia sp. D2M02]|uniref:c-type cytochrome biogenesis protein CcmI n=1 Tax=Colwellia sp. D2M02 TaxID=2841562 RepID=UPI001C09B221|nr:c-type cytochrome biogenesis protein CcmI [Colwellia sp. D2M02]MBU2894294.1 c-type cytochrome biogenesis protein CcmI [Colwellia sp. D2M02]
MELALILLALFALLLLVVWLPFFKQTKQKNTDNANVRDETNVRLYHEHKKEIEKDFQDGGIDDENYQYLLAELDSSLLQDIEASETSADIATGKEKNFSVIWPIALSVFILTFTVGFYLKHGHLEQITQPAINDAHQGMSAEQLQAQRQKETVAYIKKLQQRTQENADDAEAWYNLGQTFVVVGEFDAAIKSFEQVIRIEGEHADLLGAIAQAHYYKNDQQINEIVQHYIDKSLALDANDASTNILLGMHNFLGENYPQAISHWQRVIDANKQGVNIAALKEAVAEANNRMGLSGSSQADSGDKSNDSASSKLDSANGPQLNVSVSLSENISAKLAQGEDRVVFVYAIPTTGQRMPLAAVKIKLSDLPTVIVLNNSQAMSSANTLGSVEQVNLFAIASKLGGVGIKPGDYKAEKKDVAVNSTGTISLVIDSLVE